MKPFLTEILACPIDKFFPLDVFIFKWEKIPPEIQEFFTAPSLPGGVQAFGRDLVNLSEDEDGTLLLSDQIVLGKKPPKEYWELVLSKINELAVFQDKTEGLMPSVLARILGAVKESVSQGLQSVYQGAKPSDILSRLRLDLNLLNAYKQRVEVEEGLLRCPKCQRWYPIRECIPQMLPDHLRNQRQDLEFLTTWRDRVPPEIPREGQPFHL